MKSPQPFIDAGLHYRQKGARRAGLPAARERSITGVGEDQHSGSRIVRGAPIENPYLQILTIDFSDISHERDLITMMAVIEAA
jgi:hypothetical protein